MKVAGKDDFLMTYAKDIHRDVNVAIINSARV